MWEVPADKLKHILLSLACTVSAQTPANVRDLAQAFAHPPDDSRIMMRWWWFGPRVPNRNWNARCGR